MASGWDCLGDWIRHNDWEREKLWNHWACGSTERDGGEDVEEEEKMKLLDRHVRVREAEKEVAEG